MTTALVTGADRGLGLALTKQLLEAGWKVIAGRYMDNWHELTELKALYGSSLILVSLDIGSDQSVQDGARLAAAESDCIDLVIHNAAVSSSLNNQDIRDGLHYEEIKRVLNINAIGMLRVTSAFLPLTNRSSMKKQCIISSEAGSIERCHRRAWYGYSMSKASLNMGVAQLDSQLGPEGYSFKVFHPGWMRTYMSGVKSEVGELEAEDVAVTALAYFLADKGPEEELVMMDWNGQRWPW